MQGAVLSWVGPGGDIRPGSEGKPGVTKRRALGRKGTRDRCLHLRVNLPLGHAGGPCVRDTAATASEEGKEGRPSGPVPLELPSLAVEGRLPVPASPATPPPQSSDRSSFHLLSLRSIHCDSLDGSQPPASFPPRGSVAALTVMRPFGTMPPPAPPRVPVSPRVSLSDSSVLVGISSLINRTRPGSRCSGSPSASPSTTPTSSTRCLMPTT